MRIELDANGYVLNTYWGCYSGECIEYKGAIPSGYESYVDWDTNALINAYYLEDGDLKLDSIKLAELEAKIEQETIDNEPVLRKDLYGSTDTLNNQYISAIAQGETLSIDNVKKLNPKIKITDIESFSDNKIDIITQARNMLRNDGISEKIGGVKFTKNIDGSITINGTATEDIEYNLSGNSTNTDPLFALKKNIDYYFNIGGLDCEMKYYDGTTSQVYVGASGKINLNESKAVTQVLIKIPIGTKVNTKIYPMLEYGTSASPYEEYKSRKLTIDLSEYTKDMFYPDEDIYPDEDLFPAGINEVEYITIEDGRIKAYIDGSLLYIAKGNVNLFDGYNNVYTSQNTYLEMKYYTNLLDVESLEFLQGKATTTNRFKILEDGSIEAHNGYFSGEVNATSGKFTGTVTSANGSIGGCTIDGAGIYSGSGNTTAGVGLYGLRHAFWAGATPDNSHNAPFRVGHDGTMTCNNATANGLNINNGNINLTSISENSKITLNDSENSSCKYEQSARVIKWTGLNGGFISMWNTGTVPILSLTDNVNNSHTNLNAWYIETPELRQTSLEKNKKNFEKFDGALNLIDNIDLYKYNLKQEEDDHKKHIGFVIGDKYNYSSEITSVDEEGKETGVDLYSMTSLCLQAIKEQQEIINKLKSRIEVLENEKN